MSKVSISQSNSLPAATKSESTICSALMRRRAGPANRLASLSELVANLRDRPDGAALSRSLNGAYGDLRESEDEFARDLAGQEFREALEGVGRRFSDLTARCADLQSRLDEVLRRLEQP